MAKLIEELDDINIVHCRVCNNYVKYGRRDIKAVRDPLVAGCWTVIKCPRCNHEIQVFKLNGKTIV